MCCCLTQLARFGSSAHLLLTVCLRPKYCQTLGRNEDVVQWSWHALLKELLFCKTWKLLLWDIYFDILNISKANSSVIFIPRNGQQSPIKTRQEKINRLSNEKTRNCTSSAEFSSSQVVRTADVDECPSYPLRQLVELPEEVPPGDIPTQETELLSNSQNMWQKLV